jgi:MoaA/NifB/PqqE/SkfB family radical SAM enzyme
MASKTLSIHLTDNCNLNCKHCYLGPPPKRNYSLSLEQIKQALTFYKNNGFDSVSFRGGESFLSPNLRKAVNLAKEIGYQSIKINTNGSYPQIIDLFTPQEIDYFSIGLDGASPETHDYLRAPGHFDQVITTIQKAHSKGFKVSVSFCITRQSLNELKDIIYLLDDMGVNRLSFVWTSFIGNAIHHPEIIITPKEWIEARKEIKKIKDLKNLKINYPDFFVNKEEYKILLKEGYHCLLTDPELQHANLMANGLVFSCSLITEAEEFATHIVTEKGVIPQDSWKTLLLERYPCSSCPVQEFLRDKYQTLVLDEDTIPVCPYRRDFTD